MALSDHDQYSGVVDIARNGIDEVLRLKKQVKDDEALIRQLVEAFEYVRNTPTYQYDATLGHRLAKEALQAARARLDGKP